jgi:diguanylate cyclase (GGDEF)-like protein
MKFGAIRFPLSDRSADSEQDINAEKEELAGLRTIVDDLNVGILLLDKDNRVQFINRPFRRFWRVPDRMINKELTFDKLMHHGRGMKAYALSRDRLSDYVSQQMALIRAGEQGPLKIRFANGAVIQFRCNALPNGGRLLTYGNVSELVKETDAFERLACLDGLTGLNNRRNFLLLAEAEWSRFRRYGRALALLMIDIDSFKSINDRYGHDVGDVVIKAVADILQIHKRTSDVVGRMGGEEFALILPEATLDSAAIAAERLRQLVADCPLSVVGHSLSVTISVGVAVCRDDAKGIEEILKEADVALYQAKRSGRNRVCQFEPDKPAASAAAAG